MSRYVLKLGSEMEFNANSEFEIFDRLSNLKSFTDTFPTLGSIVQKG